ncbi:hypothetical protein I306_03290 [Cryptococcus gattii EJB2]|uniref:Uncharacterized protein n=1 Tax=Cryptococcus gattii EJB2 TaxID=1296103 RepID=A0ABR5BVJ0_9TREE|nr:hypothetical protein I306_03290 [Cryptococcus gattii EJB2]
METEPWGNDGERQFNIHDAVKQDDSMMRNVKGKQRRKKASATKRHNQPLLQDQDPGKQKARIEDEKRRTEKGECAVYTYYYAAGNRKPEVREGCPRLRRHIGSLTLTC